MSSQVVMYATPFCHHCSAARMLLEGKGIAFEETNVLMVPGARQEMEQRSGRRTVPQIFIDGEHIGGNEELRALDISGDLDRRLGL